MESGVTYPGIVPFGVPAGLDGASSDTACRVVQSDDFEVLIDYLAVCAPEQMIPMMDAVYVLWSPLKPVQNVVAANPELKTVDGEPNPLHTQVISEILNLADEILPAGLVSALRGSIEHPTA